MLWPKRFAAFASILAMPASLAVAQGTPASPAATAEVPAMGGKPSAMRSPTVIGLRANEILFSRLKGAAVLTAQPKAMGSTTHDLLYADQGKIPENAQVGTIDDLLLDPRDNRISAVLLKRNGAANDVEINFSTLRPKDQPNPSFFTTLSSDAIAKAPAATARDHAGLIAVGETLTGRNVQLKNGATGGTITDLAVELDNGAVDFAVIRPASSQPLGVRNLPRSVPWRLVQNPTAAHSQPLTLALDQTQLDQSPAFGAVAQERPEDRQIERQTGATLPPPP